MLILWVWPQPQPWKNRYCEVFDLLRARAGSLSLPTEGDLISSVATDPPRFATLSQWSGTTAASTSWRRFPESAPHRQNSCWRMDRPEKCCSALWFVSDAQPPHFGGERCPQIPPS